MFIFNSEEIRYKTFYAVIIFVNAFHISEYLKIFENLTL